MTTTEANKALIHRLLKEYWNGGNAALAAEFFSADGVRTELFSAEPIRGVAGMQQALATWRTAFPDLQLVANDLIVTEDRAVLYWTFTGTHRGELNGIPATGKSVKLSGISMARIANGKFVEEVVATDLLSLMQQLGVIPAA